jgi:succinate dehydrogenase / fumarate reductase iron-sulfur subunit
MVPAFKPKPKEADGTRRMQQEDIERGQEFRSASSASSARTCARHPRPSGEQAAFAGPRFFVRLAELEMHPLDTHDRKRAHQAQGGARLLQHHEVLHGSLPEHIHITDNAIIPLKERIVTEYHDPVVWLCAS